jgi:hypothetical protein
VNPLGAELGQRRGATELELPLLTVDLARATGGAPLVLRITGDTYVTQSTNPALDTSTSLHLILHHLHPPVGHGLARRGVRTHPWRCRRRRVMREGEREKKKEPPERPPDINPLSTQRFSAYFI